MPAGKENLTHSSIIFVANLFYTCNKLASLTEIEISPTAQNHFLGR
jgi:hypothetical protein